MKFIGRLVSGELFAQTLSNAFEVYYGDPYKLSITTFMGVAFGGLPFSSNPIVSIVDRGENIVASVNYGVIKAVLTKTPYNNTSKSDALQPTENTIVGIINGSAVFESMFINRAGYPYQITFESNTQVSSQRYDELAVCIAFNYHQFYNYLYTILSLPLPLLYLVQLYLYYIHDNISLLYSITSQRVQLSPHYSM